MIYNIVFHYHLEVEADSKERAEELACDDYKLNLGKNYQLNLGWILDVRQMVLGKEQDYEINGTAASYSQDNNLTKEVTLATNLGFGKKISDQHFLKFYLDSTISTQELVSFTGNFAYKFAF